MVFRRLIERYCEPDAERSLALSGTRRLAWTVCAAGRRPSSGSAWVSLLAAARAQRLAVRRFLFRAERFCHGARLWREAVARCGVSRLCDPPLRQTLATACCGAGRACRHRGCAFGDSALASDRGRTRRFYVQSFALRHPDESLPGPGARISPLRHLEWTGLVDQRRVLHLSRVCRRDRKSTRLNSSHPSISYAVFCLKKKKTKKTQAHRQIYKYKT